MQDFTYSESISATQGKGVKDQVNVTKDGKGRVVPY